MTLVQIIFEDTVSAAEKIGER